MGPKDEREKIEREGDRRPSDADQERRGLDAKMDEILRSLDSFRESLTQQKSPADQAILDEGAGWDDETTQASEQNADAEPPEGEEPQVEAEDDGWGSPKQAPTRVEESDEPQEREKAGLIQMTIPVGMLQCNCTIVGDPITREALVIDPGDEVGRILELLGRHKLQVKAIVSTHAHIDHVGGLAKLHEYTGAPLLMHREDLPLYRAMEMQAAFLGVAPPPIGKVDHLLKEGDSLRWGNFEGNVIHTPGHTPGSICIHMPASQANPTLAKPRLFSGDTLFAGSIGRTDLWGGSLEEIMNSLRAKVLQLPDDTDVFPGHGFPTVIGEERQSNPFLRER